MHLASLGAAFAQIWHCEQLPLSQRSRFGLDGRNCLSCPLQRTGLLQRAQGGEKWLQTATSTKLTHFVWLARSARPLFIMRLASLGAELHEAFQASVRHGFPRHGAGVRDVLGTSCH